MDKTNIRSTTCPDMSAKKSDFNQNLSLLNNQTNMVQT